LGQEGGGRKERMSWSEQFGLEDFHRDTVVAGNFGLGGQETVRIHGAREPERLFLVVWEVNSQFCARSTSSTTSSTSKGIKQLSFRLR